MAIRGGEYDDERELRRTRRMAPAQGLVQPTPTSAPALQAKKPAAKVKPFSYEAPRYQAPRGSQRAYQVPAAPSFYVAPFMYPRGEDVFEDPSYQFRLNEGLKALERSAAAKGTLRTGNTLQDLMKYGQDYASQEYGQAANRAAQQYGLNYQASRDMYAPGLLTWDARNAAEQAARQQAEQRAWQEYVFRLDDQFRREQMLYSGGLGTFR